MSAINYKEEVLKVYPAAYCLPMPHVDLSGESKMMYVIINAINGLVPKDYHKTKNGSWRSAYNHIKKQSYEQQ